MKKKKTKTNNAIGLDIGVKYIKAVVLEYTEEKIELADYFIQKTPPNIVENGIIKSPTDLGEIIKSLFVEKGIDSKKVSISIPLNDEAAVLKWVTTPDLKGKDMEKMVSSLIEDELNHTPNEVYYNWQKVETNEDGSIQILLVGSMKNAVDSQISALKTAKLKPYFAEADIFSIIRSIVPAEDFENPKKNNILVNIGYGETSMAFFREGKFVYNRSIPMGVKDIIENISTGMDIDLNEASRELEENGYVASDIYTVPFDAQIVAENIQQPVMNISNAVLDTIYFYREQFKDAEINEIILTGGGARIDGIDSFLEELLEIKTSVGEPYFLKEKANLTEETVTTSGLSLDKSDVIDYSTPVSEEDNAEGGSTYQEKLKKDLPSLHVAIGLALKEVIDNV